MTALYVGALAVALVQYLRSHERRLIVLMALLALLAAAHAGDVDPAWAKGFHVGAGLTALALVFILSPRPARHP
jgi:hypothetical protein